MTGNDRRVAIITGGSQGIGAGHVVNISAALAEAANSHAPSVLSALTS